MSNPELKTYWIIHRGYMPGVFDVDTLSENKDRCLLKACPREEWDGSLGEYNAKNIEDNLRQNTSVVKVRIIMV